MPKKKDLIRKLFRIPWPKDFTVRDLDALMSKCNCKKFQGGRGSGIGYRHELTGRKLQFDGPHPGNELYRDQIKRVKNYILEIGEKE